MKQREFQTLIKCLQMTQSENDSEALAAVRRANTLLAKHKLNWAELLNGMAQRQQHEAMVRAFTGTGTSTMTVGGIVFHF